MLKRSCRYYNATGKCHFGKHCKFLHSLDISRGEIEKSILEENGAVNTTKKSVSLVELPSENSTLETNTGAENGSLKEKDTHFSVREEGGETGICRSYAERRFCRYGNRCRYQHTQPNGKKVYTENDVTNNPEDGSEENHEQNEVTEKFVKPQDAKSTSRRICKFYRKGYCHFGKRCHFYHPPSQFKKEGVEQAKGDENINNTGKSLKISVEECGWTEVTKPPKVTTVFQRQEIDKAKCQELRELEITQLKHRFPPKMLKIIEETEEKAMYTFTFMPTDPDWPFDVRSFDIQVTFEGSYPLKMFDIDVPLEQDLPATVHRYLKESLEEWVDKRQDECVKKNIVELSFRRFLRWLDRSLENIITEGLKQLRRDLTARAAGLQFISAGELRKDHGSHPCIEDDFTAESTAIEAEKDSRRPVAYRKFDQSEDEVYTGPATETHFDSPDTDSSDEVDDGDYGNNTGDAEGTGNEVVHQRPQIDPNTERLGTEMSFRTKWVWYLTTVLVEKLCLVVQCERCKNTTDFSTPPNRVNSIACTKCNATQLVVYRPVLSHANCTTFGYLDVDGCVAYDVILQDCHFSMGCVMCGRDFLSKSYTLGRVMEVRCRGCHSVMKFAADSVKLTTLTTDGVDSSKFSGKVFTVGVRKNQRVAKDPAIQEGKPLPNNGACKHFKKSFRWLRFPCCGKTYPCDMCHDDLEDHMMIFANRMICGFCCKEQAYSSERPCTGCGGALTRVRTAHWEGGKGCRNKLTMSRTDEKKYSNLEKTVSKAQQEKKTGKKKTSNPQVKHTSNWT